MGEKLAYSANHWGGLTVFLYDGCIEIDSNAVENLIRPLDPREKTVSWQATTRAPQTGACIGLLIETCKINGVDLFAYLVATLKAIAAGHPHSCIDGLTPWAYAAASTRDA